MEPLELFQAFLNKFVPLSAEDFQSRIVPFIEVRTVKKKELVTRSGEVENYINFVARGLMRKYFTMRGVEVITHIVREEQMIYCLESFYNRTPSSFTIEAIETSVLLSISHDNLELIFSSGARMEQLGRLIMTHMMVLNERWQMNLQKLSPRERFLEFVRNNSELMQRVPQKYLASLLNIQPETFSRFKHLLKSPPATEQDPVIAPSGE